MFTDEEILKSDDDRIVAILDECKWLEGEVPSLRIFLFKSEYGYTILHCTEDGATVKEFKLLDRFTADEMLWLIYPGNECKLDELFANYFKSQE